MNTGKTIGLILIIAGTGVCLLSTLWLGVGYVSGNYDNPAAPVLGLGLAFIVVAPLVGVGIFMFIRGQREVAEFAEVEKERKLLGMVQGSRRGQDLRCGAGTGCQPGSGQGVGLRPGAQGALRRLHQLGRGHAVLPRRG